MSQNINPQRIFEINLLYILSYNLLFSILRYRNIIKQETNMLSAAFQSPSRSKLVPVLNYLYVGLTLSLSNPIDFIRIRMQTMQELIHQGRLSQPYQNIVDCCHRVVREEGRYAFWKGNCSNLLKFYPAQALNWVSKQLYQTAFRKVSNNTGLKCDFLVNYLGGAMAGITTRAILYPLEFTRNKMNNQIEAKKSGILCCLKQTFAKEGLRGIYRGALISFVGVGVFRSTYFGIYDTFKQTTNSSIQRWFVSYLSTFAAICLTYPSDTVRRRMMMTSCANYKYKGFLDCCKTIWGKQGFRGFFCGAPVIFLQSATGATIYFIFDKIIKDMKRSQV